MDKLPQFFSEMFNKGKDNEIKEVIILSILSIKRGMNLWEDGLKKNDTEQIKSAVHLIRPNLIHLDLDCIEKSIRLSPAEKFKWGKYLKTAMFLNTKIKKFKSIEDELQNSNNRR